MLKDSLDADIAGIDVSTRVSDLLQAGQVYTRDALRGILDTQDSTINNGVFRPAGFTCGFNPSMQRIDENAQPVYQSLASFSDAR
ncbi:hypothetical protein [Burkholderia sp. Cy-637]|uniref:hypothetical protein n=1 Tax=Burkholderia sp. Cy-637 TaxID=2608327 RepID=UPI0014215879|nr:hypothetical protein [Burkholderia sp. Cy-637]